MNKIQHPLIFLFDSNTFQFCSVFFKDFFEDQNYIVIPAGEENKNITTFTHICERLLAKKIGKNTFLVNVGGGVITDIGGFVASVFMRGLNCIHIPTSLMAMVDAAHGGKTGIDFHQVKNYIGTIRTFPVWIYNDFLNTLPLKEIKNGLAEIIKYAFLGNRIVYNKIHLCDLNSENLNEVCKLIPYCIQFKNQITEKDLYDHELRRKLNFGHTVGHAIESLHLQTEHPIPHGFAIASGMYIESIIAFRKNKIDKAYLDEIGKIIFHFIQPIFIQSNQIDSILSLIFLDKKNLDNQLLLALPSGFLEVEANVECNAEEIRDALNMYITSLSSGQY